MFLAKVTFGPCPDKGSKDDLADLAAWYLADLMKSGQICGEYFYAWSGGVLTGYTHLARPDAWQPRFLSVWGKSSLEDVSKGFERRPQWDLLEDDIPRRFASWRSATSLYLSTHAFAGDCGPVTHGDLGSTMPAYLVPLSDSERESLYNWAASDREHDRIWFDSGALEIPAYRQLADASSELSESGRDLCRTIEKATAIPTYYYLMRHWGRKDRRESNRPCPGCGGRWRVPDVADDAPFGQFPFRCRRCRLVSNQAFCADEQQHVRIGEFRGRRKSAH